MTSRIDELKGKVKQTIGGLTGDADMQQEGADEQERAELEREAEGAIDQGVGKAKETAGVVSDDAGTEIEGKARQLQGDIKRAG